MRLLPIALLLVLLTACGDSNWRPETEVYEAVLNAALFTAWGTDTVKFVPEQPTALILVDSVDHVPRGDPADMRPWLQEQMPLLPPEIVEEYVLDTIPRRAVTAPIRTPVPISRLSLSSDSLSVVQRAEVIELGHIFFGADSTALVELSRRGPGMYDSYGFLFMLRRINGSWRVVDYFQSWES